MVIPERVTPSGRPLSEQKLHCGLGFEKMFDCFDYQGFSMEQLRQKYYRNVAFADNELVGIVDSSLTDKFSMWGLRVNGNAETAGFAVTKTSRFFWKKETVFLLLRTVAHFLWKDRQKSSYVQREVRM